jgi:hypothetical protein
MMMMMMMMILGLGRRRKILEIQLQLQWLALLIARSPEQRRRGLLPPSVRLCKQVLLQGMCGLWRRRGSWGCFLDGLVEQALCHGRVLHAQLRRSNTAAPRNARTGRWRLLIHMLVCGRRIFVKGMWFHTR